MARTQGFNEKTRIQIGQKIILELAEMNIIAMGKTSKEISMRVLSDMEPMNYPNQYLARKMYLCDLI